MSVLVILCVIGGTMGAQKARFWALETQAQMSGMDWAHHIEYRLEHVHAPDETSAGLPTAAAFDDLLHDVIAVGNIYQIDYVNLHCQCDLSIGTYDPPNVTGLHAHDGHSHAPRQSIQSVVAHDHANPQPGRVDHLLFDETEHAARPSAPKPGQLPIDHDKIIRLAQSDQHLFELRQGDGITQPGVFAAVYHPVQSSVGPNYMLRVLVNLDQSDAILSRFFLLSLLLVLGSLLILAGYPTWRYFHSIKRQQEADAAANFLARHDVLTGLRNRNDYQAQLPLILKKADKYGQSVSLFLLDLNDFKGVNDAFGHQAGDEVLIALADLIRKIVPKDAYIARLGADEFVVVLAHDPGDTAHPLDLLPLPDACQVQLHGALHAIDVGIGGGVAQYPQHGSSADGLRHAADLALHASKSHSRGGPIIYHEALKTAFQDRLRLRQSIKVALEDGSFVPFYQPIVRFDTGETVGFEALARWQQADGSFLAPGAFETVLDDPDIGAALGQTMLGQIVADMARWQDQSIPFRTVGLNVMNADLKQEKFAHNVLATLKHHNLAPHQLAIEVTEHCLFDEKSCHPFDQLRILRDAGCDVALDDFGTGYSSMSQLKSLPFTVIKIDKLFVQNALDSADDQAIIDALRFLGKSMSFNVVLEGIETLEQLSLLKAAGHSLGQGYYFARPMPARDVPAYLAGMAQQQKEIAG